MLALMTLPTIIIVTRAALKAVPPSIREAALGVGASRQQVVFHHVLPLAMPGILTGTIIGLAQALGETAPLLLIGMNAFITARPAAPFDASTALPTQIFIWADSPERGFVCAHLGGDPGAAGLSHRDECARDLPAPQLRAALVERRWTTMNDMTSGRKAA